MPLVELKKCAECGKTGWHELVDHGPPTTSFWRCRACGDRRAAERIRLSEEYALHRGHVQKPTRAAQVQILDLSVLGARLRLSGEEDFSVAQKDKVLFNAGLQPVGPLGVFHMATVRWVKDDEFGIAFQKPLLACAADLLCMIKG
ncbi:PilZ domain-containing protein [Desulfovibrio sp. TomC]|uniref:PilZ domain-containing protein n=1 Tax=Desulfovibrio sp. TomC TaxID=1562888 RepID=UPI000574522E|nr:PilZ domain-containing protein [Desulfovibrio sp. TomC]KHK03365.1 hypothetical protein NY78_1429 [Desulfovibrio sp. TomC]